MPVDIEKQESLKRTVDRIVGLPTLPSVLAQLNRIMINPRTSAKDVANLISNDPSLTAKVLRVVNSSFYGFPSRITTITHAIVILGFNTIKSIVLSSFIFDTFGKDSKKGVDFDRVGFWKHSIAVGAASKVISKKIGSTTLEEFFVAGLLHDIGKIVVDQYLHKDFVQILEKIRQNDILMVDAEQAVLGVSHADIGSWLFQRWNLSRALVQAVAHHHNPSLAGDDLKVTAIVHLADIIARAMRLGFAGDQRIPELSESAWNALELSTSDVDSLMQETDAEMERAQIFLDFLGK